MLESERFGLEDKVPSFYVEGDELLEQSLWEHLVSLALEVLH